MTNFKNWCRGHMLLQFLKYHSNVPVIQKALMDLQELTNRQVD